MRVLSKIYTNCAKVFHTCINRYNIFSNLPFWCLVVRIFIVGEFETHVIFVLYVLSLCWKQFEMYYNMIDLCFILKFHDKFVCEMLMNFPSLFETNIKLLFKSEWILLKIDLERLFTIWIWLVLNNNRGCNVRCLHARMLDLILVYSSHKNRYYPDWDLVLLLCSMCVDVILYIEKKFKEYENRTNYLLRSLLLW